MNRNVRIAKELVRLAKALVADTVSDEDNQKIRKYLLDFAKKNGYDYRDEEDNYDDDEENVIRLSKKNQYEHGDYRFMGITVDLNEGMYTISGESKGSAGEFSDDKNQSFTNFDTFKTNFESDEDEISVMLDEKAEFGEVDEFAGTAFGGGYNPREYDEF